jgi:hypothetical protein
MDIKGTPLRKVEERREERKFRAKDASKPRGGSATAETTRREERAGDKEEEGRTHVKREHPKTQNHQRCGQLWGGADVDVQTARAAAWNSRNSGRDARA